MKRVPAWLTIEAVLAFHERLVAEHGGSPLLRDRGLLESALARPRHHFAYGNKDLYELAAAYAYAITRNHPFADGNKRSAFVSACAFLDINGCDLDAPELEVVTMTLGLSDRSVSEAEYAIWLRHNGRSRPKTRNSGSAKRIVRRSRRR